jgi:hypothetical protein
MYITPARFSFLFSNRIGYVMFSVITSSTVDRWFEPRSNQTTDYKICICSFSAKHAALRRKDKDWLARNQDNLFEFGRLVYPWTVVSVS